MQKMYCTIILLLGMTIISYAMDKDTQLNYIVYQKLNNGVPVTEIKFFLPCKELGKPEKLIKTIYLNEHQTKAFMQLVQEAKETAAWRAWTTKWNAARL